MRLFPKTRHLFWLPAQDQASQYSNLEGGEACKPPPLRRNEQFIAPGGREKHFLRLYYKQIAPCLGVYSQYKLVGLQIEKKRRKQTKED